VAAVDNSYRKMEGAAMGSIADLESIPEVVESIADLESILEVVENIPEQVDNMTRGTIEEARCTPGIAEKKAVGVYKPLCTHEPAPWRKWIRQSAIKSDCL
jgi:hypothetical protein